MVICLYHLTVLVVNGSFWGGQGFGESVFLLRNEAHVC